LLPKDIRPSPSIPTPAAANPEASKAFSPYPILSCQLFPFASLPDVITSPALFTNCEFIQLILIKFYTKINIFIILT
jgi:hypothetical protein